MRNKLHRNRQTRNQAIQRLLEHARYEVLPTATTEEKVLASVPKDVAVTVTASASKGLEATLTLAESLAKAGYIAVPHLAARMIHDFAEVEEIRARLGEAGITSVFVPGGDADPVGVYPDSFSLLEDLNRLEKPFSHVGIAGYPEPHPKIHDDLTVQAMWDKRRHATHIVSNLTFDAGAVKAWVERMRARGISQPVLLGMPGPIDRAKLLTMATKIGVGESTRFLSKNASSSPSSPPRVGGPARSSSRGAPPSPEAGVPDRGPAHVHLQPDRRDRGVAPGGARPARTDPSYRTGRAGGQSWLADDLRVRFGLEPAGSAIVSVRADNALGRLTAAGVTRGRPRRCRPPLLPPLQHRGRRGPGGRRAHLTTRDVAHRLGARTQVVGCARPRTGVRRGRAKRKRGQRRPGTGG